MENNKLIFSEKDPKTGKTTIEAYGVDGALRDPAPGQPAVRYFDGNTGAFNGGQTVPEGETFPLMLTEDKVRAYNTHGDFRKVEIIRDNPHFIAMPDLRCADESIGPCRMTAVTWQDGETRHQYLLAMDEKAEFNITVFAGKLYDKRGPALYNALYNLGAVPRDGIDPGGNVIPVRQIFGPTPAPQLAPTLK